MTDGLSWQDAPCKILDCGPILKASHLEESQGAGQGEGAVHQVGPTLHGSGHEPAESCLQLASSAGREGVPDDRRCPHMQQVQLRKALGVRLPGAACVQHGQMHLRTGVLLRNFIDAHTCVTCSSNLFFKPSSG